MDPEPRIVQKGVTSSVSNWPFRVTKFQVSHFVQNRE
jgi:hypothetical protein